MKVMKEVKHFSHSDLDGIGCIVMAKHIFLHTSHTICDYNNVNEKVQEFLFQYINEKGEVKEVVPYELVLITDISVNEETALMLEHFSRVTNVPVLLIDHHKTSLWLNDYDWAIVEPERNGKKTSGTSEIFNLLVKESEVIPDEHKQELELFAETIRLYDTWDWFSQNVQLAKLLNDLLYILGHEVFIHRFSEDLSISLTNEELYLLKVENERAERYIKSKEKTLIKTELHGYNVGVVFAEQHHSILGNIICANNPDIDFVIIINPALKKVSIRSVKDDIDTGEFAKKYYGGGGHPKASGFELDDSLMEVVVELLLKKEKNEEVNNQ
jgi:uncharacterized protein